MRCSRTAVPTPRPRAALTARMALTFPAARPSALRAPHPKEHPRSVACCPIRDSGASEFLSGERMHALGWGRRNHVFRVFQKEIAYVVAVEVVEGDAHVGQRR